MNLLVTGGAGFIGSNFVNYWVSTYPEDKVVVLDKLTYAGNLENLKQVSNKIKFIKADICDSQAVDLAMAENNIDLIVHFAAESHVDRSILDPNAFVTTNVLGTQILLNAAKKYQVKRFHHVSTDEVFGSLELDSKEKWNEQTPYNPRSPYSASKASSDHLVRAFFYTYNLPITITNCANNIGPYMFPEKLLPLAITNLMEGKKVPVYGKGDQVREWLNVKDHVSAIDLILKKGKVGETYFIGPDNQELSNLEVLKKVLAIMNLGEENLEFVTDRPGHDKKYAIDHSKITKELGWKPKYGLDESLKELVMWYKDNQDWWKKIKNYK